MWYILYMEQKTKQKGVSVKVNDEVWAVFKRFREDNGVAIGFAINTALKDWLTSKGYWPPKKPFVNQSVERG